MEFEKFNQLLRENFRRLTKDADCLYEIACDKDELWNLYLDSFPTGTNEIYRVRRQFDCSCCRHFIKSVGNIAVIKDNQVHTIWGFQTGDSTYQPVIDAMNAYLLAKPITDMFVTNFQQFGQDFSHEQLPSGEIVTYSHFALQINSKFVNRTAKSNNDIKGDFRDTRNVFKRSLDEITMESVDTVLELIATGSLYRGEEWREALTSFRTLKNEYERLSAAEKEIYAWEKAATVGNVVGRIRNHSIGALLVNVSEGMELEEAVRKYEIIVAPTNYKRPKAIFTQKMLDDAKAKLEQMGYMSSLGRRFATLDDVTINNVLFANRDSASRIHRASGTDDVFASLSRETKNSPKKFNRVEEIGIEKFIEDVLPTASSVEAYVESKHIKNMVSLIAPKDPEAPSMFKWNNAFSWTYNGNIADSGMKENVKNAGGKVDGDLRFSIQWNDVAPSDNDMDAHCETPRGHIYYMQKCVCTGSLDVDIINPTKGVPAVENITWPTRNAMDEGEYRFYVHCYNNRGGRGGFRAEIEFDGNIYSFDYPHSTRTGEVVEVATVTLKNGEFTIKEHMPSNEASREVWGIQTNHFIQVNLVCLSPNWWDEQSGNGNKHYFFMLKDCTNPDTPSGFFNEYLKNELMEHKRVFEALGAKMAAERTENQLSGIGFSSTKRDDLVVKVTGQTERVLKIKF